MLGIIQRNPKLALILGIFFNIGTISAMIYYEAFIHNIFYLILLIFFLKGIPLWSIRDTQIQKDDVYATLGFILIYMGWILWEGKTNAVLHALQSLINNKLESPLMRMLQKMFG
jgi:hypothetical protein